VVAVAVVAAAAAGTGANHESRSAVSGDFL